MEDVFVTGIGVVLPNCDSRDVFWTHLSTGDSQLRMEVNPASPNEKIPMGRIGNFDAQRYLSELPERFYKRYEREIQLYLSSIFLARNDAGLSLKSVDPTRLGVLDGCSRPGFAGWYERFMRQMSQGMQSYSRRDLLTGTPGQAAGIAASLLEARGPVYTFNNACSSGAVAIGHAFDEIRKGNADVCFATGHEASLCAPLFAMYAEGGLLTDERIDPRRAVSPFGDSRGNAFGEGAITLVLESRSHAEARGVDPIAQICAYEYGNNGFHPTTPDLAGGQPARLIERCLETSETARQDVRFVVGHGNGVAISDGSEQNYMLLVFGEEVHKSALVSNKPIYGHTLGASSALNVAAAALMLKKQFLAPTLNVRADQNSECFDHVPMQGYAAEARAGLAVSYGLGGNTTVVLLKPAGRSEKTIQAPPTLFSGEFHAATLRNRNGDLPSETPTY